MCYTCDCCNAEITEPEKKHKILDSYNHIVFVCDDCFNDSVFECEDCGEYHYQKDGDYVDDEFICDTCLSDNEKYIKCPECDRWIKIDDKITTTDNEEYCIHCVDDHCYQCESCNEWVRYPEEDNGYYCSDCFWEEHFTCECCDNTYHNDYYASDGYCVDCDCGEYIHEYGYKPEPVFYKEDDETTDMYIGVELEVEGVNRKELSENLDNETSFVYCKRDGSLDCGVEIVSHPATFKYHCNNEWEEIFNELDEHGMESDSTCGLHFHISRNYFNAEGLKAIDYFVNNNQKYIEDRCGRKFNNYCSIKCNSNWGTSNYHSDCVNFNNSNTVEVRFCASTVNYDTFFNRMTFVKNIVEFANSTNINELINGNMIEMFEKFIESNKE